MRAFVLAACLLLAAGCGAQETTSGSSTAEADKRPTTSIGAEEESEELPPPFALISAAGRQNAIQSTYCITGPTSGTCADYVENGPPEQLSVVGPGEKVELVFDDLVTAEGEVSIVRLGCTQELASIELVGPATVWPVDLEPGLYELELSAVFTTASTSGDTSASVGLRVDPTADAAIVPAPDPLPDCPDGQSR